MALKTKSFLTSFYKRSRLSRDWAKRGEGRFSKTYVCTPTSTSPVKGEENYWLFSWFEGAPGNGDYGLFNKTFPYGLLDLESKEIWTQGL